MGTETDLGRVVDGLPALAWTAFPDARADFVNNLWCEYTGLSRDEASGHGWRAAVHPHDLPDLLAAWAGFAASGEPGQMEARLRRFDGEHRWFLFRICPIVGESGDSARWYCLQTDINDWRRAEALLAAEKRLLEMVALGAPRADVLEALCKTVEENACGCLCSILSIDPDGERFRHGAGPSLPAAYNEVLDGSVMDHQYGPCGMAANWKTQVIASDVATDPRWRQSPWPGVVLGHGLRACWSTPILSGDRRVIGVFALYRSEPASPSLIEQDLTRQFAHIASIAIERAQNDASLKESNARKSSILNSALDCIVTIDHEGRITEFNPAAEHTFGYRRDQVLGEPLAETIMPRSLRESHRRGFARYLATNEPSVIGRRVELTAMRSDGGEFPVELTITRNPADDPPSFTGFMRDITEQRLAEDRLRRSNAYLAEAQRISSTGSFSWCVDDNEMVWSAEVYRMHNYPPGIPVSIQMIADRFHPDDLPLLDTMLQTARDVSSFDFEYRLAALDGSVKHIHLLARANRNQHGQLEYIGAMQDVTERRLADAAREEARSELARMARITSLSALTASIAHEVNQPLSGIITNASTCLKMLAADPPNIAGARETARRTARDGDRAAKVIKRLRALFTKKDSINELLDLNEAAQEVMTLSASDFQRRRVVLKSEHADDLPPVSGDRVQIQQVILNLLVNAADAMSDVEDRPRQILIRTTHDDNDHVSLFVEDAGVGFEPETAEKLFQAFHTTKSNGMGIGLSISRSIVENHGGRLWAESNDGPGATFAFSIPCAPAMDRADRSDPRQEGVPLGCA